jgi:hypothetical protein
VLTRHNNSIHEYLITQKGTFISFGSKFRPVQILDDLLCHHPNWPKLKRFYRKGQAGLFHLSLGRIGY